MDQRLQFLSSYQKEEMSVADLCRAYGISRPSVPLHQSLQRDGAGGTRGSQQSAAQLFACNA
jgi:hypothetical protein